MSDNQECGEKTALWSKTIHFNWMSMAATSVVPFLPKALQGSPWIIPAVSAWFTIGNIILRFATSKALILWQGVKDGEEKTKL